MPATCGACGGTVMPYYQYLVHFRPTSVCGSCGRVVRLHGYRMIMWAGVAGVAVAIAGTFLIGTSGAYSLFMGAVAVVALAADWWSWKVLTWDPIEGTPGV